MKSLPLIIPGVFYLITSSCQDIPSKDSIIETLDDSIKAITTPQSIKVPDDYYEMGPDVGSIKGNVRYLAYDDYLITPSGEIKVPANCHRYWFNKDKCLIMEKWYFDTTELSGSHFYYDKENRLIKFTRHSKESMVDSIWFTYDSNGLLHSRNDYKSGKIIEKRIINYDSLSRRCQEYEHGVFMTALLGKKYYYHSNSLNPDSVIYNNGARKYYQYSNGVLEKINNYWLEGKHSGSQYKYNDAGDVIWELKDFDNRPWAFEYTYDNRGNWWKCRLN